MRDEKVGDDPSVGVAKDLAIQQEEQGWRYFPDIRICQLCLSDRQVRSADGLIPWREIKGLAGW